ncbi:thioredoxin domain-containing protein 3 [Varanus komodoensis]|uniref:thioredoxin domain-containing protein 3 n=1 Tax=Varanus komodoensis TaxID=61221 RepID=UPI001CF7A3A1|nr:thioredoxin domain-containing protein 3 [Varanus komodoensis]
MASKKKEVQLQMVILNQTQWEDMLLNKGLTVVDVYQAWCGPCKAVVNLFRKLKNEYGEDDLLHFAVAEADNITSLLPFKDKCEPAFVFCMNGKMIDLVKGANGPLLCRKIIHMIEQERKIIAGEVARPEMQELVIIEEKESDEELEEEEAEEEEKYTVVIIKPDAVAEGKVEEIKQMVKNTFLKRVNTSCCEHCLNLMANITLKITNAGFVILAEEEKALTDEQVRDFYQQKSEEPEFEDFVSFMLSGPCYVLIVSEGKHEVMPLVEHLEEGEEEEEQQSEEQDMLGAEKAEPLKIEKPTSVKGILESQAILNLCDVQDSVEEASRQLAFFFPDFAKAKKGPAVERTLALIRPALFQERRESILKRIEEEGFEIAMQKEINLSEEQARLFYKEHEDQDYFPAILEEMTSGPTLALALVRENAIQKWRGLLGPKTVEEAKEQCPTCLRAEFAIGSASINQLHGSSTADEAAKELEFFFPVENTLAVIKPSALEEHKDEILKEVKDAGFIISEMKETQITPEMAAQFYKGHEGKPFFDDLVSYMSNGPSVVMVLTKENAVEEWRKLMGPTDPVKAKETHPDSLRAKFAKDILRNAVHGSSNADHAVESINFIFGDVDLESLKRKYVYV